MMWKINNLLANKLNELFSSLVFSWSCWVIRSNTDKNKEPNSFLDILGYSLQSEIRFSEIENV